MSPAATKSKPAAKSTEVEAPAETGTDLTTVDPAIQAVLDAQDNEFGEDTLSVPILKIGQALTKEVQNDQAEAGEFINTLTGEGLGDKIQFIVSYYQQGRAASDRDTNRYFVAFGDTIPESWEPLVGAEFVGTLFTDYPDAEERFKERVNNKEIPWGKGPKVSTTHNYTGYAVVAGVVDPETGDAGPDEIQPVRLSLLRVQMEAVKKINSLKRMTLRNRPFWDQVFEFETYKKEFSKGVAYILRPSLGRPTTPEERAEAAQLAVAVSGGRVVDNAESAEVGQAPAKPKDDGGLAV